MSPPLNTMGRRRLRCPPPAWELDLLDVDGLGAFVARLLLVGDLGSLAQRAVAVAEDPAEVDEQVTAALVGRDEAEALVVAEPLDRPGTHRQTPLDLRPAPCRHMTGRRYPEHPGQSKGEFSSPIPPVRPTG